MDNALGRFAEHLCDQAGAADQLAEARHADGGERNVRAGCRLRALAESLHSLGPAEREYVERMADDEMAQFAHALRFYDPLRDKSLNGADDVARASAWRTRHRRQVSARGPEATAAC